MINHLNKMTHAMTGPITRYLSRLLTALSVLLNVLLGGTNNQTFSARNYEWKRLGKYNIVWLIDALLGQDHCLECWAYWRVRRSWN